MKGSEFVFDYIHLWHYKCHKIYLNRGRLYIDSPDWITNVNRCFQYAVAVALNHEEIKKEPP